jgi:hypothetical protein
MAKKEKVAVPKSAALIATLHQCFDAEVKNVVQIGRLLTQLRAETDHGQWLPLLAREFSMSDTTARNYCGAFLFMTKVAATALKSEKISDLRLRPTALYLLAECYRGVDEFEFDKPAEFLDDDRVIEVLPDDIEFILKEAKERWVGPTRLKVILRERHPSKPEPVPYPASDEPAPGDTESDTEPQPDDKPPEPNPTPATSKRDKGDLELFTDAVAGLKKLMSGSVEKFADADIPVDVLETVADSLRYLVKIIAAAKKPPAGTVEIPTEEFKQQLAPLPGAQEEASLERTEQ